MTGGTNVKLYEVDTVSKVLLDHSIGRRTEDEKHVQ